MNSLDSVSVGLGMHADTVYDWRLVQVIKAGESAGENCDLSVFER